MIARSTGAAAALLALFSAASPIHGQETFASPIPLPPSAVAWEEYALSMAAMAGHDAVPFDSLPMRVYAVPLSLDDVLAFYRERWPEFRLFPAEEEGAQGTPDAYMQFFRGQEGELQPAHSSEEIPLGKAKGWALGVIEFSAAFAAGLRPPIQHDGPWCQLIVMDAQRL